MTERKAGDRFVDQDGDLWQVSANDTDMLVAIRVKGMMRGDSLAAARSKHEDLNYYLEDYLGVNRDWGPLTPTIPDLQVQQTTQDAPSGGTKHDDGRGLGALVALTGYSRSGKDSFAQVLVDDGWVRIAFADTIRHHLRNRVRDFPGTRLAERWEAFRQADHQGYVDYLVGWVKDNPAARADLVQETMYLIDQLRCVGRNVVVTDLRNMDEAVLLLAADATLLRLDRGWDAVPMSSMDRESDRIPVHATITNQGTLEDLRRAARVFSEEEAK